MISQLMPLLHTADDYPTGWLYSDWRPEPTVIVGVFALIAAYLYWTGPRNRDAAGETINPVSGGKKIAFVSGCLVMLVALNPPLDDWSGFYLLSAHMLQHMLLMFLVAPLWLGGMPDWLLRKLVANPLLNRTGYALTRPVAALAISSLIVVLWHMPFLYDAALASEPIHVIQHNAFLVAALLSLWPVMGPLPEWPRLSLPMSCLYLFLASIPGGIVGAFVSFAEPGLYDAYVDAPRIWGMGLGTDQEIAGLLMWVLGSSIYLLGITVVFFKWAAVEDAKEHGGPRSVAPLVAGSDSTLGIDSSTSILPG